MIDKLEGYLFYSKQSIYATIYEQPTRTLAKNFLNTVGSENPYIRFYYVPKKISNTTKDKFQDKKALLQKCEQTSQQ